MDRLAAANWALRSPGFTELAQYDDGRPIVVMHYQPAASILSRSLPEWLELRLLWRDLPLHSNLLEAVGTAGVGLRLRYAALDWKSPLLVDEEETERLAGWGVQLCDVYEAIASEVPPAKLVKLMNPFAHVDLEHRMRIGFRPISNGDPTTHRFLAPETQASWPRVDQRALVYLVGRVLARRSLEPSNELGAIIARCLAHEPDARFATLAQLSEALSRETGHVEVRGRSQEMNWRLIEEGIGWLAVEDRARALVCFQRALASEPTSRLAGAGWNAAHGRDPSSPIEVKSKATPYRPWDEVKADAASLEAARKFSEALRRYGVARSDPRTDAAKYTAIARCHLQLREATPATAAAQRALAADADHLEARSIHARALLLGHRHLEALAAADALLVRAPDDAMAHYTRGKALFALRRLVEARDSFERACQLRPAMLEAMLLRREADRALGGVRRTVGEQPPMIELPAHLAELRIALAAGRFAEVITELEAHGDAPARLIRARLLLLESRLDEALACYASIDAAEHRRDALVGQATVLLELDRPAEALALFELALRDAPDDLDIADGRARALAKLGRSAEAEPVFSPQP